MFEKPILEGLRNVSKKLEKKYAWKKRKQYSYMEKRVF